MVVVMKAVINIQVDKMVEEADGAKWALDITPVQTMDMVVDVANPQEVNMATAVLVIGVQVAAIGEPGAMKVVVPIVDIPKSNTQEEDRAAQESMMIIMIVPEEVAEVETPVWEKVVPVHQADEVDAVVIGN